MDNKKKCNRQIMSLMTGFRKAGWKTGLPFSPGSNGIRSWGNPSAKADRGLTPPDHLCFLRSV